MNICGAFAHKHECYISPQLIMFGNLYCSEIDT